MTKILFVLFLLFANNLYAGHINPYTPTQCSGSWDGVGFTGCELLGEPGHIGVNFNFNGYIQDSVLYEITARDWGNSIIQNNDGSLSYVNLYDFYNSYTNPVQFAYWFDDEAVIVGIEDLTYSHSMGSDYDYNDYIVRYVPATSSVPESGTTLMMLMAISFIALYRVRV